MDQIRKLNEEIILVTWNKKIEKWKTDTNTKKKYSKGAWRKNKVKKEEKQDKTEKNLRNKKNIVTGKQIPKKKLIQTR